jgi:hypothetical protein
MLLLLLACAAPGKGGDDPCLPGDGPTLTVGTGELAFEPVAAGDTVELVHGPQGGFHTHVGLSATFLDASATVAAVMTGSIDGEVLAESAPYLTLRCNPETHALESWGTRLIWDALPEDLDGKPITVSVTLTDAAGTTLDASVDLLIEDPTL